MKQFPWLLAAAAGLVHAKLADRSRLVKQRLNDGKIARYHDSGRPLEGPQYRAAMDDEADRQRRWQADAELRLQQANGQVVVENSKQQKTPSYVRLRDKADTSRRP